MVIEVVLVDAATGKPVGVSPNGELLIRPFDYSTPVFQDMDAISTAYLFAVPEPRKQYIITDIIAFADRNVTTQTLLEIYEGLTVDTTTITKQILRLDLLKQDRLAMTGLHFKVTAGRWLLAKHDDDDVFLTIAGYYIDEEE